MKLSPTTRTPLNSGGTIPVLGLGVWQMARGTETEQAVDWALKEGYRHIDTAKLYRNEESVGKAVLDSGIPRADIFITTKLWPTDAFDVETAFEASLKKLGTGYIDLYLVHWPVPLLGSRVWKRLEALYDQKLARAIGVSNYTQSQIEELLQDANVPPAVNQIEFNPFAYERDLVEYCQEKGIVIEAYSPLTRGVRLDDETVAKIAMQHAKTPAQVMLRWALQKNVIIIPKSSNKERIKENSDVFDFELSEEEMRRIDSLSVRY
jgi:diketogulonate reductase-like aldo/keto reductase